MRWVIMLFCGMVADIWVERFESRDGYFSTGNARW
jgi:hypothetical protein